MEINKLPHLKNKNFLESEIRRFATVRNIIDKIEEENYNKFNQIEFIKKTILLEKKKKTEKYSRAYSLKHYTQKNNTKVVKKIENQLIKKKLKLGKKPKLVYDSRNSFKDELFSPLNQKYQSLISNIDYNKRCFRNLSNKDFDSIFKDNSYNSQDSLKKKSMFMSTSYRNKNINKNLTKKRIIIKKSLINKEDKRLSNESNKIKNNNIFANRIKNIKMNNYINKNDTTTKSSISKNTTFFHNYEKNSNNKLKNKLFNEYVNYSNKDIKYGKFVFLLKKQNDKNIKLLNDVKKQHTMNKDNLLVSMVKLNGYKPKKYTFY